MSGLPADLARPRYGAASLADVLPGAATALGVAIDRGDLPPDPLDLTTALAEASPYRDVATGLHVLGSRP